MYAHELPYTPEAIRAHLHTLILGKRMEMHEQVGSTNDLARVAGRRGEPEGLIIVAEEQIAGRGRMGRVWAAPPGCCVLCSVLLRPRFPPEQAFYLTIAASLAIYRACKGLGVGGWGLVELIHPRTSDRPPLSLIPLSPTIKWPNDVLIRGRKVAGILCESEFGGEEWDFAVVGFGINANLGADELGKVSSTATSLSAELGRPVDRAMLLARVLVELEGLYLSLGTGQFRYVHSQWVAALETLGKQVSIGESHGTVTGRAVRVDPDGALVVRTPDGERRVIVGDVL